MSNVFTLQIRSSVEMWKLGTATPMMSDDMSEGLQGVEFRKLRNQIVGLTAKTWNNYFPNKMMHTFRNKCTHAWIPDAHTKTVKIKTTTNEKRNEEEQQLVKCAHTT